MELFGTTGGGLLSSGSQASAASLAKKYEDILVEKGLVLVGKKEAKTTFAVRAFTREEQTKQIDVEGQSVQFSPAHDSIVCMVKNGDTISFSCLMLGDSGDQDPTATELLSELEAKTGFITIPADTYDSNYSTAVGSFVTDITGGGYLYSGDCVFIPQGTSDEVITKYVYKGINQCLIECDVIDANLNIATAAPKGTVYEITHSSAPADIVSDLGIPKNTKWGAELKAIPPQVKGFNSRNLGQVGPQRVLMVSGGFDWYVGSQPSQTIPGVFEETVGAILTINNLDMGPADTINHVLLGIGVAQTILTKDYHAHIAANLNRENVGALGVITKGQALKLGKGKSLQEKYEGVRSIVTLPPVMAIDIASFSDNAHSLSAISAAALSGKDEDKKFIVEAANVLTNGAFPKDFPLDKLFTNEPVTTFEGYYVNNKKERVALSECTAAQILDELGPNGVQLATEQILLNSGVVSDPKYGAPAYKQLANIVELGYNPRISTKSLRVIFNPLFIDTLSKTLAAAGLSGNIKSPSLVGATINFNSLINLYQNAGMSNIGDAFSSASSMHSNMHVPYYMQ